MGDWGVGSGVWGGGGGGVEFDFIDNRQYLSRLLML